MKRKFSNNKILSIIAVILGITALSSENLLCMGESGEKTHMNQEGLPSYSAIAQSIAIGSVYEHYKGLHYRILAIARHSETLEEMVVYQALYRDNNIWTRPLGMFLEDVTIDGQVQPRFKLVK